MFIYRAVLQRPIVSPPSWNNKGIYNLWMWIATKVKDGIHIIYLCNHSLHRHSQRFILFTYVTIATLLDKLDSYYLLM